MNVKICTRGGPPRKKYLADLINAEEFRRWKGRKIFIEAPTGLGKSTFIIKYLLPYCKRMRWKVLIISNRRLLRQQYWQTLVRSYESYHELEESVAVMTYQELAELIKRQIPLEKILYEYAVVVCDEAHFFYADADFNGFGTYVLLQELVAACAAKTQIFMSATMTEVEPLIEQTLKRAAWSLHLSGDVRIKDESSAVWKYDFSGYADYSRFQCVCVPDWESLCEILTESNKKTVIFLNNKEKGRRLMEQLLLSGKVTKADIEILNAENLDVDSEVVQNLAVGNRLMNKILITTSVLDNGVSIHDPEVGNVVIETESKIEFLQMIGRLRSESTSDCKLYFVLRDQQEFAGRMNRYEEDVKRFKCLSTKKLREKRDYLLQTLWNDDDEALFYRKALVWMNSEHQFFEDERETMLLQKKGNRFFINRFAERKIADMFVAESRFYGLALTDPLAVIYEQMAWIGKTPEELEVIESTYKEKRKEEFLSELKRVQAFSADELKDFKNQLTKKFRKEFFPDVSANNGTISNEKLEGICVRYGLLLENRDDDEKRRKIYFIKEMKQEEGEGARC